MVAMFIGLGSLGADCNCDQTANLVLATPAFRWLRTTQDGIGYAWGKGELSSIANTPATGEHVEYQPPNGSTRPRTEVHVFVQDPQDDFDTLLAFDPRASAVWDSTVSSRPRVAAIPYPPPGNLFPSGPETVGFSCSDFMGPPPPGTYQMCLQPISAVRVYDRGGCSTQKDTIDIADQLAQSVWCSFDSAVTSGIDGGWLGLDWSFGKVARAHKNFTKRATTLTHVEGQPNDAPGGFALYFDWYVDFYGGNLFGELWLGQTEWHAVYQYWFVLNNGYLALGSSPQGHRAFNHEGTYNPNSPYDQLHEGLVGSKPTGVLAKFAENAAKAQHPTIPVPACPPDYSGDVTKCPTQPKACDRNESSASQCIKPMLVLATGINNAVPKTVDPTLNKALGAIATDSENWICDHDDTVTGTGCAAVSKPGPDVCKFKVQAKRLNVYADNVELVWSEYGDSTPSTGLALQMALRGLGQESQLCSADHPAMQAPATKYYATFGHHEY